MAYLPLFARTFLIGIAVAAPVGAMGVLCVQRTLTSGWPSGLATGAGIATADGAYAALAAFGVAAVSALLVGFQTPLRLVGGAMLLYLGVRSILTVPDLSAAPGDDPASRRSLAGMYGSALGLTLTNPMTVMAFGAILAGSGLSAQPGATSALVATIGIATGSLSWWVVLVTGTSAAHAAVGPRLGAWVSRVSGGVIVAFGVLAIGSVFVR